jgi:hypothetical protein
MRVVPLEFSFVTKPSKPPPAKAVWKAPRVVGKFVEAVRYR